MRRKGSGGVEEFREEEKTDEYGPAASRSIPLIAQLARADDMNAI